MASTSKNIYLPAEADAMRIALGSGKFLSDIYYVDKTNGADTNSGLGGWANAFKTITAAIAAAGNYDAIYIAPGFYTEAAALTITQVGLKLIGMNTSGKTRGPCGLKTPTAAGHILNIGDNVNDVEISNLAFIATGAYNAITLGSASYGYVWRTHIHDCGFFGDDVGLYAIAVYGATTTPAAGAFSDLAECVVERCHFYAWATACTCVYGTRHMVRDNSMFIPASGIGIVLGCGRPFSQVTGNFILGKASGDTGIKITGNDDGSTIVALNSVANCATLITKAVSDAGLVNNWAYLDGTAPGQCDPT